MDLRASSSLHPSPPGETLGALRFVNGYAGLPEAFHTRLAPEPLPEPYLVGYSASAGALIGLGPETARDPDFVQVFSGNRIPPGADPLAAVYSGHQFGVYVPRLGDGRALLLGEVSGPDGAGWELQLKGSGRTPYSRSGDGRAVLRSSIREFLGSEAMAGLGIPTTRALAVIGADTPVMRETVETAAVVTRMAASFVRFGSFEYFAHHGRTEELRQLADFVIARHYPQAAAEPEPVLALLTEVVARTARLVAQWQGVGFMHGVLNTDNMSILGLTLDYGPFQFMDGFDAHHICNHSDTHGRYSYANQPDIGLWNLYALAQALLPLSKSVEATQAVLDTYRTHFAAALEEIFHAKLGLLSVLDADETLIDGLLSRLHAGRVDWTLFWRRLAGLRLDASRPEDDAEVRDLFADRAAFDAWAVDFRARLRQEGQSGAHDAERAARMRAVNPCYVLRNWMAEEAIAAARGDVGARDFAPVERLRRLLERPYEEQPGAERYAALPPDWAGNIALSCSS
ncbi:MAG: hypothetical protein RI936_1602 [Pseudomonadota bacterium]